MPVGSNRRQSRFLLRRSSNRKSVGNVVSECEVFLSSSRLGTMISDLPDRPAPWEAALKKALALWETLETFANDDAEDNHEGKDIRRDKTKAMWEMLCVLIKANFYLQTGASLERARVEAFDEYIMHCAVGLTCVRPAALCPVIERLLHSYSDQLAIQEPVRGRLPLHVAAATPFQPDRIEILRALVQAYPRAATEKDSHGIYPLHLACQNQYTWKNGIEALYNVAPHVGELTCPCCPPELLARQDCYDQSMDTIYALVQTDSTTLLA